MTLTEQMKADDGQFGQPGVCSECGDDGPWIDEATELCEMCYEHIMGPDDHLEPEQPQ